MMQALLWQAITQGASCRGPSPSTAAIPAEAEAAIDSQILNDISSYYDELRLGFASTHIPRVGCIQNALGFSTLTKHAYAITLGPSIVGKLVCTLKRSGALKIGPIAILPEHRECGYATTFLISFVSRLQASGIDSIYATVPRTNTPAQKLFQRAGFVRCGELRDHYRCGIVEDVFTLERRSASGRSIACDASTATSASPVRILRDYVAARFFPVDDAWEGWLRDTAGRSLGNFARKPHDLVHSGSEGTALVVYKRGGTAKIVPVVQNGTPPSGALIASCERRARQFGRTKASLFLPEGISAPPGYICELVVRGYALQSTIAVWSRRLA